MNILGGCKQGFWTSMKMDFDSPALHTYLMLHVNPDFQPCPPFQSAVTEELIKWVWLARAEKSIDIIDYVNRIGISSREQ